jgi:outer membrane protein, heavy metal efflux system
VAYALHNASHMTLRALSLLGAAAICVVAARASAEASLPSPLRPDDVVAFAKEHRAEIVAARAKAAALAETPKVVSALPDPMVMISVDHLPLKLMGADASLLVQQDFPLSGVLGKKKSSAEADASAAGADVGRVSLDVQSEALLAYLMVVERERMLTVLDEQIATAKQIVEATLVRLEGGSGNAGDIVRARLDVARLTGERAAVDAELAAANGMLNASLGRSAGAAVPKTSLMVPAADPPDVTKLVATALGKRPELAVMKFKADKASADVAVMKSMYSPMAFVRTGPSYTMTGGVGVMLMVGVTVPLWREKLSAGVAEASQMTTMVDAEIAAMRKMIEGEVATARGSVVAARIRYETARDKLVPIAKQAVTLQLASYATGQAPLVSVLDSLSMMRMTRMEEVVAEIRLAAAWVRLGRATGVVRVGPP